MAVLSWGWFMHGSNSLYYVITQSMRSDKRVNYAQMVMSTVNASVDSCRALLDSITTDLITGIAYGWFSCLTCAEGQVFVTLLVPGAIVCTHPNQAF